jgi:hypothetical protein
MDPDTLKITIQLFKYINSTAKSKHNKNIHVLSQQLKYNTTESYT